MPNPGTAEYDRKKQRLRSEYENQGVPDKQADIRANAVLQDEIPQGVSEPKSRATRGIRNARIPRE